jgi:hypothetical protein
MKRSPLYMILNVYFISYPTNPLYHFFFFTLMIILRLMDWCSGKIHQRILIENWQKKKNKIDWEKKIYLNFCICNFNKLKFIYIGKIKIKIWTAEFVQHIWLFFIDRRNNKLLKTHTYKMEGWSSNPRHNAPHYQFRHFCQLNWDLWTI